MAMGELEGKVAFITGAARGQGRAHAVAMAQEGADIIAVDLCGPVEAVAYPMASAEDLAQTVAQVEDLDRRIVARQADVRDRAALQRAVDAGVQELGGLDIVVANAGIWAVALEEPTEPAVRERVWRDTIDINLTGAWNTVEVATPHLLHGGRGGAIVLTCSIQGLQGAANNDISLTAYTASKHGMVGLMRVTAIDLAPHSIRCNTIHPTGVLTGMIENEVFGAYAEKNPRLAEVMGNALPVPLVELQDVVNAVLYLVSERGRYITGITLPVDAGALVR
jgi:SDR family mycofactocin-dependent oxidoreductase